MSAEWIASLQLHLVSQLASNLGMLKLKYIKNKNKNPSTELLSQPAFTGLISKIEEMNSLSKEWELEYNYCLFRSYQKKKKKEIQLSPYSSFSDTNLMLGQCHHNCPTFFVALFFSYSPELFTFKRVFLSSRDMRIHQRKNRGCENPVEQLTKMNDMENKICFKLKAGFFSLLMSIWPLYDL